MKKWFILAICCFICLSIGACSQKIEEQDASDQELTTVINATNNYLNSDEFKGHTELFETTFGQDAKHPEVNVAFTFKYDDVEGFAYDLILLNIIADAALNDNGEIVGFDAIQVIIDNKDGKAYDSLTYNTQRNQFTGEIKTYEDAIIGFLNSGVLINGGNDYLWSENETSTRFNKDNIKQINAALNN